MVSPQLRGRRQHTKSRRGCQRCKSRKVKCDETHPGCQNCCRLGLPCSYSMAQGHTPSEFPPAAPASQLTLRPARSQDNAVSHTLDLRLLHHYVTSACGTFPFMHDQQILNFWSISVPKMGFKHEILLDALLGATAFHMSARLPNDKQLAEAGFSYYGRAVTKHREALSTIDRSTADPLCVASIFIMLMTFNISRQRSAHAPYAPPFRWFRIINGMGCLIRHSASFLESDGIHLLMQKEHISLERNRDLSDLPQLPDLGDLLSLDNAAFDNNLDQDTKTSRQDFGNTVSRIFSSAVAGASRHSVRYQLLGLAATNNEQFLRLVEQKDILTIIVLSHYFALLKWTGGNWWLQSELDTELFYLFSSIPQQHQWAVATQSYATGETESLILSEDALSSESSI